MAGIFATVYKGEISVTLVDKKYREDNTAIYAAKLKKELEPFAITCHAILASHLSALIFILLLFNGGLRELAERPAVSCAPTSFTSTETHF